MYVMVQSFVENDYYTRRIWGVSLKLYSPPTLPESFGVNTSRHIEDNNISPARGFALYMSVSMRKGFEILYSLAFRILPESLMR
jgi:hypothetical protein